jgi:hypothetical protein
MDATTRLALAIARSVMKNHCVGAYILGPYDHVEAAERIEKITGSRPKPTEGCYCAERKKEDERDGWIR